MPTKLSILQNNHRNSDDIFRVSYGTAGFRMPADRLDHVMFRMGILATLRSAKTKSVIGVMITASHNPVRDNGVKLVDPMGEMLDSSWEQQATNLANVADDDLETEINSICKNHGIEFESLSGARVAVARDTRPSSLSLSIAVRDGVDAFDATLLDFGQLSTPQLHYIVRCLNTKGAYGEPTEDGYFTKICSAFLKLKDFDTSGDGLNRYKPEIVFDGANGVGADKMKLLLKLLPSKILDVEVINDGTKEDDVLNQGCGADHVKTTQSPPTGAQNSSQRRHASVDGDADRIVYFYFDNDAFVLLDGDKISSLVARFLKDLLKQAGLESLALGVVQTAYANGSSTIYMTTKLGVPVACVPTGVKHLHHRASQFDVGVYFEANGHGTVVFSETAEKKILEKSRSKDSSETEVNAAAKLTLVMDLINQTVGDAISDLLLVETALMHYGWNCQDWNATYVDFPNKLMKCLVPDRNAIKTTDSERKVTAPAGLQERIDTILSKFPQTSRAFVRPSGTEDVVRVYAEAPTIDQVESIAESIAHALHEVLAQ